LLETAGVGLTWENVFITLVDERCVNEASDRSNTAMLKKTLLDKLSSKPKFYPLYIESESDVNTAKRMQSFPKYFDVVHLGMGEDAHTASFFPDSDNIETMLDIHQKQRFFSTQSLSSQEKRLTWSLTALINAHYIVVQIAGEAKKNVMDQAIERVTTEGAVPHVLRVAYPILAVLERTQIKSKKGVPLAIDYADIS